MKAHLGVDSKTKLIHIILASAANVPDVDAPPYLLHGRETRVWGDQGDQGRTAVIHACAPRARDFTNRRYRRNGFINETEKAKNRNKSRVPAGGHRSARHRAASVAPCVGHVSAEAVESGRPFSYPQTFPRKRA
jgi:IS5 family transposase